MADISQITLPNGDVITLKDSAGREAATTGLAGKVSIAQGIQNQGKILQVSSGGVLELVNPSSGSGDVTGPASSVNNQVAVFDGTTGKVIKDSGFTIGKSVPSDAVFTDTTYESKTAASGGTDVSLVTTGEKYTWNSKPDSSDIPTKVSDLQNDSGFTDNEGTVTGVKMNNGTAIEPDANGVVDLGTVITSHQDISGKADLVDGKVPSTQLPSYVDDVLEYASQASFPLTGETGKIYVAIDTNKTYRWSGSAYIEISESLALGETSSTAYRGDRGADAYAAAVTNVDSTPMANSTHLITSGGVAAALPGTMTGATSSTNGASGLVPAPVIADKDKFLRGDGSWSRPVVILTYGVSTYTDFENAFNAGAAIYCRATSDTSDQTLTDYCRYANLSYVNSNPSMLFVEFMYYRTTNPTSTAYGDEVYVYKLTGEGVWSTTKRYASLRKIQVSGDGLSVGWNSSIVTLTTSPFTGATSSAAGASGMVPAPTTSDSNKFLKGDGTWAEVSGGSTPVEDKPFSVTVSDWILVNNEYKAEVTNSSITAECLVDVMYDKNFSTYATADIYSEKSTGKVTLYTDSIPTGTITGNIRIFMGDIETIGETKADKVTNATAGDIATLDANGNLVDSGKTLGVSVPANAVFTDTTYSAATQSADGLMSAADKTKLDNISVITTETVTVGAASWTSEEPPTQTVNVTGVTATNNITVSPDATITAEQYEVLAQAKILCTAQAAGTITLTCYGTVPEVDIPLSVKIGG